MIQNIISAYTIICDFKDIAKKAKISGYTVYLQYQGKCRVLWQLIMSVKLFTTRLFSYFLFSSSEIMVDICYAYIMHSYNTGIPLRTNYHLQQIMQSLEKHVLLPDCL